MTVFEYDFGEFEVGTGESSDGTTGVTVIGFPAGAVGALDARGGAVCGRHLDALRLSHPHGNLDALVLSGGGALGLDAASGVAQAIIEERAQEGEEGEVPPTVIAAATQEREGNGGAPDAAVGAAAYRAAKAGRVTLGRVGAGVGCTVGGWFGPAYQSPSGQGAATFTFANIKIFALSVVNALGNVVGDRGQIVRGVRRPGGGYDAVYERIGHALEGADSRSLPPSGNTTLSVLVTNLMMDRPALHRLAVMAHAASARVIDPIWAPEEGDVVFAISTRSERPPDDLRVGDLGVVVGRVVQQAILRAAP